MPIQRFGVGNSTLPKVRLCLTPSPLLPATRLAKAVGADCFYIKRDDLLGLAGGGNKVRKLEYIMAKAINEHVDAFVLKGHDNSNFIYTASIVAAMYGKGTAAVILVEKASRLRRSEAILAKLRTPITWIEYDPADMCSRQRARVLLDSASEEAASQLRSSGMIATVLEEGGASPEGSYSFFVAFQELQHQMRSLGIKEFDIYLPVGTGSTYAGLYVASKQAEGVAIRGVAVAHPQKRTCAEIRTKIQALAAFMGLECGDLEGIDVIDATVGVAYGVPTPESIEMSRLALREEGILLDSTYTAKTLAALLKRVPPARDVPTVFWLTGGTLQAAHELFDRDDHA